MPDSAHTYTPKNNSLEERIRSCRSALESFRSAEQSKKCAHDKEWTDRLGSPEEIQYAFDVSQNSVERAAASLDISELYYAKEQGLLTNEDLEQLTRVKKLDFPKEPQAKDISDDFDGPDF